MNKYTFNDRDEVRVIWWYYKWLCENDINERRNKHGLKYFFENAYPLPSFFKPFNKNARMIDVFDK